MGKKNKSIYFLLPIVILIWSLVIFQVVDSFSDEESIQENNSSIASTKINRRSPTKFNLKELKRDPFSNINYKPKKTPVKARKKTVPKNITWPNINYLGQVSSTEKGGNEIYIITIDGEQFLLKEGHAAREVTLINAEENAVVMRYGGEKKRISN